MLGYNYAITNFMRRSGSSFLPARDGTVAFNLGSVSGSTTTVPFINLVKSFSRWSGSSGGILTSSDLNANCYPTSIPGGDTYVEIRIEWGNTFIARGANSEYYRNKNIVLKWVGDATVTIVGTTSTVSSAANRVVFQITGVSAIRVRVTSLGTTGISDLVLCFESQEALLDAGEIFNPDWLTFLRRGFLATNPFGVHTLRFMDWMGTNGSTVVDYADFHTFDSCLWTSPSNIGRGVPISVIIALANKVSANAWVCLPHMATEACVQAIAADIRDGLDSRLKVIVETSNETWNFSAAFTQTFYYISQAVIDWGSDGAGTVTISGTSVTGSGTTFGTDVQVGDLFYTAGNTTRTVTAIGGATSLTLDQSGGTGTGVPFKYLTGYLQPANFMKYATLNALAWDAEFGASSRVLHVLPSQAANTSETNTRLAATAWLTNEPLDYVDPVTVFDIVATAPYFGGNEVSTTERLREIVSDYLVDPATGAATLDGYVQAELSGTGLANILVATKAQFDIVSAEGLEIWAYESGVHITNSNASEFALFFTGGTTAITSGQTITGASSSASAVAVADAVVTSGSYGASNAVGFVLVNTTSGTFSASENLQVSAATVAVFSEIWRLREYLDECTRYWLTTAEGTAAFLEWAEAMEVYTDGPVMQFALDGEVGGFGPWSMNTRLDLTVGDLDGRQQYFYGAMSEARWFGADVAPSLRRTAPTLTGNAEISLTSLNLRDYVSANTDSWSATGLPSGVAINSSTGVITGTPAAETSAAATITITNAAGSTNFNLPVSIGPVIAWNPADISPDLWLDASDPANIVGSGTPIVVTGVNDISGNTRHGTSGTDLYYAEVQVNGLDIVSYDGAGSTTLVFPASILSGSAGFVFGGVFEIRPILDQRMLFSFGQASTANSANGGVSLGTDATASTLRLFYSYSGGTRSVTVPSVPSGTPIVVIGSWDGSTLRLEVDDLTPATLSTSSTVTYGTATPRLLSNATGGAPARAGFGEFVWKAAAPTGSTLALMKTYLANKWVP